MVGLFAASGLSAPVSPPIPVAVTALDEAVDAIFALEVSLLHARRCSLLLRSDDTSLRLSRETGLTGTAPSTDGAARGASLETTNTTDMMRATALGGGEDAWRVPLAGTVSGLVMRTRVPLLVPDLLLYDSLPTHPERYATRSFISVPILVENEAAGVLNVADRADGEPFSEDDLRHVELAARALASVLHSDLLARRAHAESEVDPATGMYNAQHLEKRLAQEALRARREGVPLTLLLLNVGAFKGVETRVGAQGAGALMRCVGEMARQAVRQSDVLAYYGPATIAILLPATSLDKARRVARGILREVVFDKLPAHLRYECESLDLGAAVAPLAPFDDGVELLRRALQALIARPRGESVVVVRGDEVSGASPSAPRRAREHQEAISTALRVGVPYLAEPAAVGTVAAAHLLTVEMARTYHCFPVAFEAGTLTLAMENPTDASAIQAVSQVTGMAVCPVASPREQILQAIATRIAPHGDTEIPGGEPRVVEQRVSLGG